MNVTESWKDLRDKLEAARYRFLKLHKLNYEWQCSDDPAERVSEYHIVVPVDLDHPDNADGPMSFDDAVDVLMEKDQLEKLSCARKTAPEDTVEILRAQNRELYAENDRLRQDIEKSRRSPQLRIVTDKWGRTWTPEALLGELGKRTESLDETLRENAELREKVKRLEEETESVINLRNLAKYYELNANAYLAQVDEAAAEIRSLRAKENDLKAQNRELYEENDKLRQEIGSLRIKTNQVTSTATYQSVLQDNDSLRTRNAELERRVDELMKDNDRLRVEAFMSCTDSLDKILTLKDEIAVLKKELKPVANVQDLLALLDKRDSKMLLLKEKIDELTQDSERLTYVIEQENKRRCWLAFWVEPEADESVNHEIPLQQSVRLLIDKYRRAKE